MTQDFSHVPPPDPEYFWWFSVGEKLPIGNQKFTIQLKEILPEQGAAELILVLDEHITTGILILHKPVVLMRNGRTLDIMTTATLRVVEPNRIAVQMTFNPKYFKECASPELPVN